MATPFHRGDPRGWAHEAGPAGSFHTFDALAPGGVGPRPVHLLLPPDRDDGAGPPDQTSAAACWKLGILSKLMYR